MQSNNSSPLTSLQNRPPSSGYSTQSVSPQQSSEAPSSNYAPRQISSPPGAGPQQQTTLPSGGGSSAYPQSASPPYPVATNVNNAAYRPSSSGGPQAGGNVTGAPQQRPYQPMAGQPAPQATIPQNPPPQSAGGPPLLRRMDSRSSMSVSGPGGGGGVPGIAPGSIQSAVNAPGQQQQQQLNRPPAPGQQPLGQNMMPRPSMQQQQQQQQMFRPPQQQQQQQQQPGSNNSAQQQQFQKMPPNFQQPQQQPRPQMMMRPPQMGPSGQPMPQQMRPQFPGPRPTGQNPNPQNMRPAMQAPGQQFQQRISEDQKALDSLRPSSRNGKLSTAYDDDDDVVIGRAVTPNYSARQGNINPQGPAPGGLPPGNGMRDPQLLSRPPSQQGNPLPFQLQHSNSKGSLPSRPPSRPQSRPPSGPDNPSSPSPEGMMKQGVNFLESSEGIKSGLNLRTIPEMSRDGQLGGGGGPGQQFRIGQMVNKPLVPNANFQSSSVNLNAILNVDRSRPLSRELPPSVLPSGGESSAVKRESDLSGWSKNVE